MDSTQQPPENIAPQPDPRGLLWARNTNNFDVAAVKPHACMERVEQRGNYIHCFNGNHGMRIPPGKILMKDAADNWDLIDMEVRPSPELPKWAKLPKKA